MRCDYCGRDKAEAQETRSAFCVPPFIVRTHSFITNPQGALTLEEIMAVNISRCEKWHEGGVDSWTPEKWITAIVGELGEMANVTKKLFRIRDGMVGSPFSVEELEQMEQDEWGDTMLYMILFAAARRIDPSETIRRVFNRKSEQLDFPERL